MTNKKNNSVITEAPSIINKLYAASGNSEAQGIEDSKKLAKVIYNNYTKWIGASKLPKNNKTFMTFLVSKVGLVAHNARLVLDRTNVEDPTKADKPIDLSDAEIKKLSAETAKFSYENNLVPATDKDKDKIKSAKDRYDGRYGSGSFDKRYNPDKKENPAATLKAHQDETQKASSKASKEKFDSSMKANGLTAGDPDEYVDDLIDILKNMKTVKDIQTRTDKNEIINQLTKIGFAFIKSKS